MPAEISNFRSVSQNGTDIGIWDCSEIDAVSAAKEGDGIGTVRTRKQGLHSRGDTRHDDCDFTILPEEVLNRCSEFNDFVAICVMELVEGDQYAAGRLTGDGIELCLGVEQRGKGGTQ